MSEQIGNSPSNIYGPVQGGHSKLSSVYIKTETVPSILLTFVKQLKQVAVDVILLSPMNIYLTNTIISQFRLTCINTQKLKVCGAHLNITHTHKYRHREAVTHQSNILSPLSHTEDNWPVSPPAVCTVVQLVGFFTCQSDMLHNQNT